jgi:hypothetical protein
LCCADAADRKHLSVSECAHVLAECFAVGAEVVQSGITHLVEEVVQEMSHAKLLVPSAQKLTLIRDVCAACAVPFHCAVLRDIGRCVNVGCGMCWQACGRECCVLTCGWMDGCPDTMHHLVRREQKLNYALISARYTSPAATPSASAATATSSAPSTAAASASGAAASGVTSPSSASASASVPFSPSAGSGAGAGAGAGEELGSGDVESEERAARDGLRDVQTDLNKCTRLRAAISGCGLECVEWNV